MISKYPVKRGKKQVTEQSGPIFIKKKQNKTKNVQGTEPIRAHGLCQEAGRIAGEERLLPTLRFGFVC